MKKNNFYKAVEILCSGKYKYIDVNNNVIFKDNIISKPSLSDIKQKEFELDFFDSIQDLNNQRDKELNSLVIDNILVSENIVKTMSVKYNISLDDDTISWIDINNQTIIFTKIEFGSLLKKATDKIEYIYFKYRKLKDDLQ
jgi:hypothetical protein